MTKEELDITLARLGLTVPETERNELLKATHFIEEMAALVKKPRPVSTEPAYIVSFPKE